MCLMLSMLMTTNDAFEAAVGTVAAIVAADGVGVVTEAGG